MRTEKEIRAMIDAITRKNALYRDAGEYEAEEFGLNQIDALLWVLGDESGGKLYGEF